LTRWESPRLRGGSLQAVEGSPESVEGFRRSDEVANSTGVGASLRSGSQVQSDRYPEVPQTRGRSRLRARRVSAEQAHEGRAQAQRLIPVCLGGGKGHESIGRCVSLTGYVSRTDSWSEQRSVVVGSTPDGRCFKRPFADPDAPNRRSFVIPSAVFGRSLASHATSVARVSS
jgi:hypothetical protein